MKLGRAAPPPRFATAHRCARRFLPASPCARLRRNPWPAVKDASYREVQVGFAGTAWTHCNSWYRDASGGIVSNWPGYMREYVDRTRVLDPAEYTFVPLPERHPAAG